MSTSKNSAVFASRKLIAVALVAALGGAFVLPAQAADAAAVAVNASTPDGFIKGLTNDVLTTVKADKSIQAGDVKKVAAVVDQKIMPHVNFQRMTAAAVGRGWRQATPDRKSTRLNSSHSQQSRMPSSA